MSTQLFTSGPANIWVGQGSYNWSGASNWKFVGYTRRGININIIPHWEDMHYDYSGDKMPADLSMMGYEALISGVFSRYDESVVAGLTSFLPDVSPGELDNYRLGTLVAASLLTVPLLVHSPYGFKTQYGTMVPGFLFYSSVLYNPYSVNLSMRPKNPELSWRSIPVFGVGTGGSFIPGIQPLTASRLFTNTMPNPMPLPD